MEILTVAATHPGSLLESRQIPSDVSLVVPLVCRLVGRLVAEGRVTEEDRRKVELCLDEAVTNAVTHGNDSNFEKLVTVRLFESGPCWGVLITDEGEGFDADQVPDLEVEEQLWQESGRGIALMRLYMDEVVYFDGGRSVRMIRACAPAPEGGR
ncbi:MAG: ATP-binding protein [Planctomycetota bacterium]|jgi:serine/threonine-protein kinase RsbW